MCWSEAFTTLIKLIVQNVAKKNQPTPKPHHVYVIVILHHKVLFTNVATLIVLKISKFKVFKLYMLEI